MCVHVQEVRLKSYSVSFNVAQMRSAMMGDVKSEICHAGLMFVQSGSVGLILVRAFQNTGKAKWCHWVITSYVLMSV